MDKREFKNIVYGEIASLTKALSNSHRIEILDLLANGEKSVEQIANETSLTIANASQHLQHLKRIRLVRHRREKNFVIYRLDNPYVYAVWKALREFSRYHIPEINRSVEDFHHSRNIEAVALRDLERFQPITLIDVRPEDEYIAGHIEGAIHIAAKDLPFKLNQLDKETTVVTYCRGPFCSLADDAADILQQKGFRTLRLEEGALDV